MCMHSEELGRKGEKGREKTSDYAELLICMVNLLVFPVLGHIILFAILNFKACH